MRMPVKTTVALFLCAAVAGAVVLLCVLNEAVGATTPCKYVDGPAIEDGKAALETGDVTPALKWVSKSDECVITSLFAKVVVLRGKGPEAKELADQYFIDTLVRLHRVVVRDAPYYGIGDPSVDPVLALVDKAMADKSADEMTKKVNELVAVSICQKFTALLELKRNKDKSIESGRKYAEAHGNFINYLRGVHDAVVATGNNRAMTMTTD